jgi:hypothetical protein
LSVSIKSTFDDRGTGINPNGNSKPNENLSLGFELAEVAFHDCSNSKQAAVLRLRRQFRHHAD